MKKGLSILIAISLLLGGTLFFGCEKQSDPEVNVSPEPATAKEIIFNAFDFNTTQTEEVVDIIGETVIKGENDKDLKIDFDLDYFKQQFTGIADVVVGEEKMSTSFGGNTEAVYVHFKELFDAPILFPLAEENLDTDLGVDESALKQQELNDRISTASQKITSLIQDGRLDTLFVKTDSTATLDITDEAVLELLGEIEELGGADFRIKYVAEESEQGSVPCEMTSSFLVTEKENSAAIVVEYKYETKENGFRGLNAGSTVSFNGKEIIKIAFWLEETDTNAGKGEVSVEAPINTEANSNLKMSLPFEISKKDDTYTITAEKFVFDFGIKQTYDIDFSCDLTPCENGYDFSMSFKSLASVLEAEFSTDLKITVSDDDFSFTPPEELEAYDGDFYGLLEKTYPEIYGFFTPDYDIDYEDVIDVDNGDFYHTFFPDGTGSLSAVAELESYIDGIAVFRMGDNKLALSFDDARKKLDGTYSVTVNGIDCIAEAMIYEGDEHGCYSIKSVLSRESDYGSNSVFAMEICLECKHALIYVGLDYTTEGNLYNIVYFDGATDERTVLFEEESEEYYFEGDIPPSEAFITITNGTECFEFDLHRNELYFQSDYAGIVRGENGKATLVLESGYEYGLTLSEKKLIDKDATSEYYEMTINGIPFEVEKYFYEDTGEIIWTYLAKTGCDCLISNVQPILAYYGDSEDWVLTVECSFEKKGDVFTIYLPDGTEFDVTIKQNENGEYYFAE